MSFGSPTPIELAVQGINLQDDYAYAQKVQTEFAKLSFLRDLQFAQEVNYPTLDINVSRDRAGQFGLTMADVVRSVVPATSSSRFTQPNYWRDPNSGNAFQIQVQLPQNRVQSVEDLRELPVMQNGRTDTELTNIADLKLGTMPGVIERNNGQRVISLTANLSRVTLGESVPALNAALARVGTPPRGISIKYRGQIPPLVLASWAFLALVRAAPSETGSLAPVLAKPVSLAVDLPGEIAPFLSVSLHAKVQGYVDRVLVDRGSVVKQGDLLVELSAPEMAARTSEAESKLQAAHADRLQAEAQLAAAQSSYDRMEQAADTPGAGGGNELIQAQQQMDSAKALLNSRQQASRASEATVRALRDLQSYLKITAPFDGVVTERLVHPGALVGPDADSVLLILRQVSHLRLVVAVPEENVGAITRGSRATFTVPAHPDRTYSGTVARIARALDQKTRTMAVELDVWNPDGFLAPGMYSTVKWPVQRKRPALFVPKSSVVTTTERTFVIREQAGRAHWVDVKKGVVEGDLIEVTGELQAGEMVVRLLAPALDLLTTFA
jgi:membrane fusion protein, multidrug efflux system